MPIKDMKNKSPIFFLLILAIYLFLPFFPSQGQGLVPCGGPANPCTFCHFFEMIANIINFLLYRIVPVLAVLMVVIGGFMYIISGAEGSSQMKSRAVALFKAVAIGLFLIYGKLVDMIAFWARDAVTCYGI